MPTKYTMPSMRNKRQRKGRAYLLSEATRSSLKSWSTTLSYLARQKKHVDLLRGMDEASLALSVLTTRSFSMHGFWPCQSTEKDDFSCPLGLETYLKQNKVCNIT
jgi:hypothetical protein